MAKENEVVEKQPATVEEARAVHTAKLDALVAGKKARSRKHAQFLVNAGELKLP
jgi:RNA-binding protein YlmH